MSKKSFPPDLVAKLNENPNVVSATEKSIQFTDRFKVDAVDAYFSGKSRRQIFEEAGFDVEAIGARRLRGHSETGSPSTRTANASPPRRGAGSRPRT